MTSRQAQLLTFIRKYIADHGGTAPSYAEMTTALGLRSKSGVKRILGELESQGRIRRSRLPRSVEIVEVNPAIKALKSALARYDAALDRRDNGDVAANLFVHAAREILGAA